jgi:2-methylcitrate dehydratase PrpD
MRDPAYDLAAHVAGSRFEDLPRATVLATKRDLLDTYGCLLGGSAEPGIAELRRLANRWGGAPEAPVLVHGDRLPAPAAAQINGAMAHALDFDDVLDHGGSIHPGASVLAASLAAASLRGDASGKDLVLAATLGLDVACRIALASPLDRGWHRTSVMGVFGATAAAASLLRLPPEQVLHGFGIAYSQAAGNRQCILDGALTKRLQAGLGGSGGVFAAMLAREGFTGATNIFGGRYGFLELYQPNGSDIGRLTEHLGEAWRGDELSFKPYPCGRPLHAAIDAALALRQQLGGSPVATLRIACDAATYHDAFESGSAKRRPTQIVEAQFALPFLLAAAMVHGKVGIGEVAAFDHPAVLDLAGCIEASADASRSGRSMTITAVTRDGHLATVETTGATGSPAKPLSDAQLAEKFRDCAARAAKPVDGGKLIDAIMALDTLADLRAVCI